MAHMQLERRPWEAYAASGCAGAFAAVSLYWAVGGTAGLRTLGGYAARMARSGDARATTGVWAVVAVKAGGAVLALSLVRPWGEVFPRRWRAGVAGTGALLLTVYGGVNVVGEAAIALKIISPSQPVDWAHLRWYLGLWDPWFLIWGLFLGAATWRFVRRSTDIVPADPDLEVDGAKALA